MTTADESDYTDPFNGRAYRLSSSWILPPYALAGLRTLISLYAFATHLVSLIYDSTHGDSKGARDSFSYFTNLTLWGIAFYNAFAALHTFSYARSGIPLLARWNKVLRGMHYAFYSSVVVFPFIVTIVYWALLWGPTRAPFTSTRALWSAISVHGLNSFFALLEIILPRSPPLLWLTLPVLIVLLACYLALAYLTYYTKGFYVYSFLDIQTKGSGQVAGYCVGILVACCIIFVIVRYLIWVRVWAVERKGGKSGKRSSRDAWRSGRSAGGVNGHGHAYTSSMPGMEHTRV